MNRRHRPHLHDRLERTGGQLLGFLLLAFLIAGLICWALYYAWFVVIPVAVLVAWFSRRRIYRWWTRTTRRKAR